MRTYAASVQKPSATAVNRRARGHCCSLRYRRTRLRRASRSSRARLRTPLRPARATRTCCCLCRCHFRTCQRQSRRWHQSRRLLGATASSVDACTSLTDARSTRAHSSGKSSSRCATRSPSTPHTARLGVQREALRASSALPVIRNTARVVCSYSSDQLVVCGSLR